MDRKRLGILLLVGLVVVMAIGMLSLVVGFVTSSVAPIYVSVACSVAAPFLLGAGLVLLFTGAAGERRP